MATVRTNVSTRTADVSRDVAREVREAPVQVNFAQQAPVEVQAPVEQSPSYQEAPAQNNGWQGGSQQAEPVGESTRAPRHMGSTERADETRQQQQDQSRSPRHFAELAGMSLGIGSEAQQPAVERGLFSRESSSGIPMVDASAMLGLDAMSSRQPTSASSDNGLIEMHDALAEAGVQRSVELSNARGRSRYGGAAAPSIPSQTALETLDSRRSSLERAFSRPESSQVTSPTQEVIDNEKNDSIFNRPIGYSPKTREIRAKQPSQKRPSSIERTEKDRASNAFKQSGVGYRIYQKIVGNDSLDLREVGIGMQELMAVVNQNADMINSLISESIGTDIDVSNMNAGDLARFINSNEIYAVTYKPPNNQGPDTQRRRLRILTDEQRGIYLHPIMSALYNADFDGDDMEVSLSPNVLSYARDPMSYLINIDGKQMLNLDFFPVVEIVGGYRDNATDRDYVREVMLSRLGIKEDRYLVDAIIAFGKTEKKSDSEKKKRLNDVCIEARNVASAMYPTDQNAGDDLVSKIMYGVYNGMHDIRMMNVFETIESRTVNNESLPSPIEYDDAAIYKLVDDMVAGEIPNNFQAMKVMLSGYIGNIKGKNAAFRFTGDLGKTIKMDSRLQIGDGSFEVNNDTKMSMFYESLVRYVESRSMAKEIKRAGRSEYYTQHLREAVIEEVGFPDSPWYDSFSEFLDAFVESYSRNAAIINESNLVFLTNMKLDKDSSSSISSLDPSYVTFGSIADPFLSIYDTYSVGRMFHNLSTSGVMGEGTVDPRWKGNPNHVTKLRKGGQDVSKAYEREYENSATEFWVNGKYLSYSLRKFKNENRLVRSSNMDNILSRSVFSDMSDNEAELYMLLAIADKRTGAESKFNQSVYGMSEVGDRAYDRSLSHDSDERSTVDMISDLLMDMDWLDKNVTISGRRDQMRWIDDIVMVLAESGPDMFTYFGMDSPAGFLSSDLSRKLVEHAGDTEVLGGIRTAMVFEYRMSDVSRILDSMPNPNDDVDLYAKAYNDLEFAIDELAAASEVWHGIVSEMKAEAKGRSVFQMIKDHVIPTQTSVSGETYEWSGEHFYDARDFWRNIGQHDTLRSVIEDLDMDRNTKWNIIADVVRYWENDAYLKSWEVGYQLEIGNDSTYSLGSSSTQSALGTHKDFEQAFNKWSKVSYENIQKNIEDAAGKYRKNRNYLMNTLARLDSEPWEMVNVDDGMYADSILAVKDKVYAQTEKGSQHPWMNAMYSAQSFQRVGGYMNDIQRTDDRLLGIQSTGAVSVQDVIHLLANGDAEITVYNDYGEYATVTREILLKNSLGRDLGPDIEQDIWDYLLQEPRIASAIRKHNACVVADGDGSGYLGAALGTTETIGRMNEDNYDPISHVKYLVRDHTIYPAIISLASPGTLRYDEEQGRVVRVDSVSRNERQRITEIDSYLAYKMYESTLYDISPSDAAMAILEDLGITEQALIDAITPDFEKYAKVRHIAIYDNSESVGEAKKIYDTAVDALTKYIDDVGRNIGTVATNIRAPKIPERLGVDMVSAASFWDVIQEFSGAKTAVSTGIEGSETYNLAKWVSHMPFRDNYADLESVFDDVDQSWDGMWTNVVDESGMPVMLQVDEDGNITNYRSLMRAKREQNLSEVVTLVPDGYTVRDRSLDGYNNPVSSAFIYMVSKRSNGAEGNNLKVKKSGIDGKDSITKMPDGKYLLVSDEDGNRRPVKFEDRQKMLRDIVSNDPENGLMAAKLSLAQIMLSENDELGYDDLTLSNYMSIVDKMVVIGEDGELYLRSLEMLASATRYRIGARADEMSDKELSKEIDRIVSDMSENGVGMSRMNPTDAFDEIRPKSKSSSFNGIRLNSSSFTRNYELLEEIRKDAEQQGVLTISRSRAQQLTENITNKSNGIRGVAEVFDSSNVTRSYNVVGYAGAYDGSETIHWTIGPSNAIVIGNGPVDNTRAARICEAAYRLGMTVIVGPNNLDKIPRDMVADAMPCSNDGTALIPCFDMRLNGSEAKPYNGGRFSIFQAPASRYTTLIEDPINFFKLGDAQYITTKYLTDRTSIVDSSSEQILMESLFPNVYNNDAFLHCDKTVSLASASEVSRLIVESGVMCTIDYGVVKGGRGFEQRKHDVDAAIERYRRRWPEANADGILMGEMAECEPGDIVAWAEIEITDQLTGETQYAFAPIIPFPLHGATKGIPEKFSVEQVAYVDNDNTVLAVDWRNTSSLEGGFAKVFGSSGGTDKGIIRFSRTINTDNTPLLLKDGTKVDLYCARESIGGSRKVGTDRRIKTMYSLMAKARLRGYNFAEVPNSFPLNPDIKERLLSHPNGKHGVPSNEWKQLLREGNFTFINEDPLTNDFLNYECRKILFDGGNPCDYLSSMYTDENGVMRNTRVMWEFDAMFEQGLNYENCLLRFLHLMDDKLCPNGLDDTREYLFRLNPDGQGYDRGCLEMEAPFPLSNNRTGYVWATPYIGLSFFGEDFSGFSRPNVDGASNFLDAANTMSYLGIELDDYSAKTSTMWATADQGRLSRGCNSITKVPMDERPTPSGKDTQES